MQKFVLFMMILAVSCPSLIAQIDTRTEDQFWKKRLVNRISLTEKINQPLVKHQSDFYAPNERFNQTNGLISSLLEGLKKGQYVAYHPEGWEMQLSYDQVEQRMREFEQALTGEQDQWEEEAEAETTPADEGWSDEWTVEEEWASPFESEPALASGANQPEALDLGPYEEVVHLVEDWVFDKNRSEMVQKPDFFEVIWVDPSGALPEKVLARFRWQDVRHQLDKTMWKARFNDATALSVREVFELRLFHSFLINVGGEPIMSLQEAQRRKQEIIEFEHHLWSY